MSSLCLSLKVISLIDVFTPDSTLEKFQTLWVGNQKPHSCASCHSLLRALVCVCVHVWKSSGMDVWEQASSWLFWLLCAVVFPHHSNELFTSVHVSWLTLFPFPICCFYLYFLPLWLFVSLTLHLSLSSYMVMPFVAQDLGHIMKKRRLTDRIITYLFYQLLRGLQVRFIFLFNLYHIHI